MKRMVAEVERLLGRLTSSPDIVVVEDSKNDQYLIEDVFSGFGCQVCISGDGRDAIELLHARCEQKKLPDLIFLDLQLPTVSGLEVLKVAREIMSSVPVVIITGQMTRERLYNVAKTGYVGFIEKPLTTDGLEQIFASHRIPYKKST